MPVRIDGPKPVVGGLHLRGRIFARQLHDKRCAIRPALYLCAAIDVRRQINEAKLAAGICVCVEANEDATVSNAAADRKNSRGRPDADEDADVSTIRPYFP